MSNIEQLGAARVELDEVSEKLVDFVERVVGEVEGRVGEGAEIPIFRRAEEGLAQLGLSEDFAPCRGNGELG